MNTQNRVNKLMFSKTELATHKVELGLVQDLNKSIDKLVAVYDESASYIEKVIITLDSNNLKSQINTGLKFTSQSKATVDELLKASKDLGVEPPEKIQEKIKQLKSLEGWFKKVRTTSKKAADTLSAIF